MTPAETPCGELSDHCHSVLTTQLQQDRKDRRTLRPLPLSDPFISLTSFDAKTKPEPTDKPSLQLGFFLLALSIYNFLLGLQMGQDVKVERVESLNIFKDFLH